MKSSLGHSNLLWLVLSQNLCLRNSSEVFVNKLWGLEACSESISHFLHRDRCTDIDFICGKGHQCLSADTPPVYLVFILSSGTSILFHYIRETDRRTGMAGDFLGLWDFFQCSGRKTFNIEFLEGISISLAAREEEDLFRYFIVNLYNLWV